MKPFPATMREKCLRLLYLIIFFSLYILVKGNRISGHDNIPGAFIKIGFAPHRLIFFFWNFVPVPWKILVWLATDIGKFNFIFLLVKIGPEIEQVLIKHIEFECYGWPVYFRIVFHDLADEQQQVVFCIRGTFQGIGDLLGNLFDSLEDRLYFI